MLVGSWYISLNNLEAMTRRPFCESDPRRHSQGSWVINQCNHLFCGSLQLAADSDNSLVSMVDSFRGLVIDSLLEFHISK